MPIREFVSLTRHRVKGDNFNLMRLVFFSLFTRQTYASSAIYAHSRDRGSRSPRLFLALSSRYFPRYSRVFSR